MEIDVLAGTREAGTLRFRFELTPRQRPLLTHIDRIGATLARRERCAAFAAERLARLPWLARMLPGG